MLILFWRRYSSNDVRNRESAVLRKIRKHMRIITMQLKVMKRIETFIDRRSISFKIFGNNDAQFYAALKEHPKWVESLLTLCNVRIYLFIYTNNYYSEQDMFVIIFLVYLCFRWWSDIWMTVCYVIEKPVYANYWAQNIKIHVSFGHSIFG